MPYTYRDTPGWRAVVAPAELDPYGFPVRSYGPPLYPFVGALPPVYPWADFWIPGESVGLGADGDERLAQGLPRREGLGQDEAWSGWDTTSFLDPGANPTASYSLVEPLINPFADLTAPSSVVEPVSTTTQVQPTAEPFDWSKLLSAGTATLQSLVQSTSTLLPALVQSGIIERPGGSTYPLPPPSLPPFRQPMTGETLTQYMAARDAYYRTLGYATPPLSAARPAAAPGTIAGIPTWLLIGGGALVAIMLARKG